MKERERKRENEREREKERDSLVQQTSVAEQLLRECFVTCARTK